MFCWPEMTNITSILLAVDLCSTVDSGYAIKSAALMIGTSQDDPVIDVVVASLVSLSDDGSRVPTLSLSGCVVMVYSMLTSTNNSSHLITNTEEAFAMALRLVPSSSFRSAFEGRSSGSLTSEAGDASLPVSATSSMSLLRAKSDLTTSRSNGVGVGGED